MSVSAIRLINNVSAPQKNGLLASFFSQQPAPGSLYFRRDINRLEYYPVKPADGSATLFWLPETIATNALFLGVGDADLPSTGGTADLNYDGDDDDLTGIAPNISATALQAALNANATIQGTGQTVAVTELSDGAYQIAWSGTGAKELVEGNPDNLDPESIVFASWFREGDGSTKAIQLLQFIQRPYVYVDSWTATPAATATVTELREGEAGDPGVKAMFEVEISPLPYSGSFSIAGSGALAYNGSQADWQAAMGSSWSVVKTADARLTIERTTAGVYTLESSDVDVAGLSVYRGLIGQLGFNAASLYKRFLTETGDSFETTLHIRFYDGTNRETLLSVPVTLSKDVLSSGALAPSNWNGGFYTKAEVDAARLTYFEYSTDSTSSAEDIELSKGAATTKQNTLLLTVGAGAGTYTTTVSLDVDDCAAGDVAKVILDMPASANPTIEIRNATSGGTLLYTLEGTGAAFRQALNFIFNGTAWISEQ